MTVTPRTLTAAAAAVLLLLGLSRPSSADAPEVRLTASDGKVDISIAGQPVATYLYNDKTITRPYFAHVRAPNGRQVTRTYPPVAGQDVMDHPTFHPGIWMAFGDISGSDYWRLKARVRHAGFVEEPKSRAGQGTFAVRNEYLDQQDPTKVVCNEVARYKFATRPAGYLLLWDSTFTSGKEFYFGDQEEMGLGIRVATPIRVASKGPAGLPAGQGAMTDSQGRKNEKEIGRNTADWCDYSGPLAGQHSGITIFCHPENFRPSWFHARDYGLLEANPFGRHAFKKGDVSKVVVKPGESLRLRYGVLLHSESPNTQPDLAAAYQGYLQVVGK
jgi:hypothetical protein